MNIKLQTSHCLVHFVHLNKSQKDLSGIGCLSAMENASGRTLFRQGYEISECRNTYSWVVYFSLLHMVVPLSSLFQHITTPRYSTHISVTYRFASLGDVILHCESQVARVICTHIIQIVASSLGGVLMLEWPYIKMGSLCSCKGLCGGCVSSGDVSGWKVKCYIYRGSWMLHVINQIRPEALGNNWGKSLIHFTLPTVSTMCVGWMPDYYLMNTLII